MKIIIERKASIIQRKTKIIGVTYAIWRPTILNIIEFDRGKFFMNDNASEKFSLLRRDPNLKSFACQATALSIELRKEMNFSRHFTFMRRFLCHRTIWVGVAFSCASSIFNFRDISKIPLKRFDYNGSHRFTPIRIFVGVRIISSMIEASASL